MADITARDVIQVVIGVLIAVVMIAVLMPFLNEMIAEGGALEQYAAIVGIIPMILVVVVLLMTVGPIMKKF